MIELICDSCRDEVVCLADIDFDKELKCGEAGKFFSAKSSTTAANIGDC